MFHFKDFDELSDRILTLKIKERNIGDEVQIPYYWYDIYLNSTKEKIGDISIRIGENYHSFFNGNVGYYIEPNHRGHHYAYLATLIVLNVAKSHGMKYIYMTCEQDNSSSYKTIEKLGGKLVEILCPPKDYFAYYDGIAPYRIYKIILEEKKEPI